MKALLIALCLAPAAIAQAPTPTPLTLAQAEQLALQNHPQLRAAQYSSAALLQDVRVQESARLPNATGDVTGAAADSGARLAAGLLNNPSVLDREADGVNLSQLISDFGRTTNLVQSSKLHAEAGQSGVQATRDDVLLGAEAAYFAALRGQALVDVANQEVSERQVVSNQVSALAQAKQRSDLDVGFANFYLAQARLDQAQAQNNLLTAQASLALALGLPGPAAFTLEAPPLAAAPPDTLEPLLAEARAHRPELAGLRLDQMADLKFAAAEADLSRPTLSAAASAGFIPAGESPLPDRYAAAGINLSIPIFNGSAFDARKKAAELRAQAAAEDTRQLENVIVLDVQAAWLRARTAFSTLDLTRQLLDQAQRSLDLAQARYNLGLGSIVELSQSQLNLTQAQTQRATAVFDFQTAAANLEFQVGDIH